MRVAEVAVHLVGVLGERGLLLLDHDHALLLLLWRDELLLLLRWRCKLLLLLGRWWSKLLLGLRLGRRWDGKATWKSV